MTHALHCGTAPRLPLAARPSRAATAPELRRVVLFLVVGLVGLCVDTLAFSGFFATGLSRAASRAPSLLIATGVTWSLNRRFTFGGSGRPRRTELARYALVTLASQGTSYLLFLALSAAAPGLPPLAPLVAAAAAATLLSFTGQRCFTFRGA